MFGRKRCKNNDESIYSEIWSLLPRILRHVGSTEIATDTTNTLFPILMSVSYYNRGVGASVPIEDQMSTLLWWKKSLISTQRQELAFLCNHHAWKKEQKSLFPVYFLPASYTKLQLSVKQESFAACKIIICNTTRYSSVKVASYVDFSLQSVSSKQTRLS